MAVEDVSKVYWQWQRGGTGKDVLKNLLHPQKRRVQALDALNLTVNAGEFVAYAGANGAGKSTTIKILAGILQPSEGRVRVLGMDPAKDRVRLMARIGVLFGQRSELWWDYPVIASYEWKRAVWNIPQEKYDEMLNFATEILELGPILNTFARELSLGQKMRADLGMLLLHDPQVIFLDEPTLGLDLLAKRSLIRALKTLNRQHGTTILVTSHDMDDLQEMADRIVLLSRGRLAYDGTFAALRHGEAGQGGQVRIRVQSAGGTLPPVEGLRHLSTQNGESLYALDTQTTNINQALAAIATLPGIRDIEIQQPSIEDVIARLYQSWAAQ
ncbi:ATP-binding cassette domain-containing protein [Ruminococcaceae bacterium OttesenSCG-928-O06]|nr:ATP-binding cassette domain-containing protein [Ruminococcaceae bacterium OttesenSCG-928-O06]